MTPVLPQEVKTDIRAGADDRCAACDHPWSEHDALGMRFCTATVTSSLSRGCICR